MISKITSKNSKSPGVYGIRMNANAKLDKWRVCQVEVFQTYIGDFVTVNRSVKLVDTQIF